MTQDEDTNPQPVSLGGYAYQTPEAEAYDQSIRDYDFTAGQAPSASRSILADRDLPPDYAKLTDAEKQALRPTPQLRTRMSARGHVVFYMDHGGDV